MSKEVYQWSLNASGNGFATADGGMPEGQPRESVNDSARERMRAHRNFLEDPTWLRLVKEEYTKIKDLDTAFHVFQTTGGPTDATAKFPVGCRLRFTADDVVFTYGYVATVAFNTPNTDVTVTMDSGEVIPVGLTDIATHVSRDVREAAFSNKGTASGEVPDNDDLGTAAYKNEGAGSTLDADTVDGQHASDIIDTAINAPNFLMNSAPSVWQRGTSFTAATPGNWKNDDNTVLADAWGLLSDGNDRMDVDQEIVDLPPGASNAIRCTGATVPSNQKFGYIHILEAADTRKLANQAVSFSCYVKAAEINAMRMAILSWSGSPDLPAMDVVSLWNSQKTNPTLIANWSYLTAPSDKTVTSAWTQIHVTSTFGATPVNCAVFVWCESNYVTGNILRIGAFDFYQGAVARPYREPNFAGELALGQRRFWKSFAYETAPAQSVAAEPLSENDPGQQRYNGHYPVAMFTSPTVVVTTYNPVAANANWSDGTVPTGVSTTPRKLVIGATASPAAASDTIHATVERRFN